MTRELPAGALPAGALPSVADLEVLSEVDAELSSLGSLSETEVEELQTGDVSGKAWTMFNY